MTHHPGTVLARSCGLTSGSARRTSATPSVASWTNMSRRELWTRLASTLVRSSRRCAHPASPSGTPCYRCRPSRMFPCMWLPPLFEAHSTSARAEADNAQQHAPPFLVCPNAVPLRSSRALRRCFLRHSARSL
ncbi:hypothetical protein C8Q76DRAFT_261333 [Earliella scabrosa]|nr:hypothetical protein C8Q76DRAFT_261333 [Earliella scabrosa]